VNLKRFNQFLLFFIFIACNNDAAFKRLNGKPFVLNTQTKVFIFLNPECPICLKYQGSFSQYKNDSLIFVFPGKVSEKSVKSFIAYDSISLNNVIIDDNYSLTKKLSAKITPQAIITNNGKTVYSGLIDDRFAALGSSRSKASINYIRNALNSLIQNDSVTIANTEAVGCFIEPH
jgi:hypothetical protein